MTRLMSVSLPLVVFLSGLLALSCGPKQLTQERAQLLLQERLDADKNQVQIDYTEVNQLIDQPIWANVDALTPEEASADSRLTKLQQLAKAGLVTKTASDVFVANLTGEYSGSMTNCFSVQLSLQMDSPPAVDGTYAVQSNNCWPRPDASAMHGGRAVGSVSPSGQLALDFQPPITDRFPHATFTVAAFATFTELRGSTGQWPLSVSRFGDLSGKEIRQYTYSMTPSATQLVTEPGKTIAGGQYSVTKVINLLLAGETSAQADFEWSVSLNAFASAVVGEPTVTGTGKAEFGKQPSGEWVLTEYRIPG
jgi:hypothetical protein